MCAKSRIVTLSLEKDLKVNLFVRQSLNEDHALYLAALIENGVKLPAIEVARHPATGEWVIVDGRHRREAYLLNNFKEVEVEVLEVASEAELIALAYRRNTGGALPPSTQDTEHTVALLLEKGETQKKIAEMLNLPPALARKFVQTVQSKLSRARMQRAIAAVADGGLSAAQASEQYKVDLAQLKLAISGKRRKAQPGSGIEELQRRLTRDYMSLGRKNGAMFKTLLEKYEDADVTAAQIESILAHCISLQQRAHRNVSDWSLRFEALKMAR